MFGKPINGREAQLGALLLGYPREERELCLAIPVDHGGQRHVLIISEKSGDAFLPSESWLDTDYWDVSGHVTFHVEPKGFEININSPIQMAQIGFDGESWFLGAPLGERARWSNWINVSQGTTNVPRLAKIIRFASWQLVAKDETKTALFSHETIIPIALEA